MSSEQNFSSWPVPKLHYLLAFLLGFLFIYCSYVGLPFDFSSDYAECIHYAEQFSFKKLLSLTLNPFTPGWFFIDEIVFLRPLTILFFKFNEYAFGVGAKSFIITEAISCGLLSSLFFHVVYQCGNKIYAFFSVILYLSFPPIFFSTISFPHMEYLNTILRMSSVILFGYLTLKPISSKAKHISDLLVFYFLVLCTIKLRSSDKLLPLFFISFLILNVKSIFRNIGKKKYFSLLFLLLFMLTSVVPIRFKEIEAAHLNIPKTAEQKEAQIRSIHLKNIYGAVIYYPNSKKGEFPFLTFSKHTSPRSLSESYGISCWFFWGFLVASFFLIKKITPNDKTDDENLLFLKHFFKLLLLLTFAFSFTFFSDFVYLDARYLSFILVPSVMVFILSILIFENTILKKRGEVLKLYSLRWFGFLFFRAIVLSFITFTVVTNFRFYTTYLRLFGGATYAFAEAAKKVYVDLYRKEPEGHDLYLSFSNLYENNMLIDWYDSYADHAKEIAARPPQELYILSRGKDGPKCFQRIEPEEAQVCSNDAFHALHKSFTLMDEVNYLDAPPIGFRTLKAVRSVKNKQNDDKIYIYKAPLVKQI